MTSHSDFPRLLASHLAGSMHRTLHLTDEPAVSEILAGLDGYVQARRDVLTLAAYRLPEFTPPPDPEAAMTATILNAIDTGRPIPERLVDEIPDVSAARHHFELQGNAVNAARETLVRRLDSIVEAGIPALFGGLTAALVQVVEDARGIVDRGGRPMDAESAIDAGRVEDFQRVRAVEQTYGRLRALHHSLERGGPRGVQLRGDPLSFKYYVRNPLECVPDLRTAMTPQQDMTGHTRLPEWPENWAAGEAVWWFAEKPTAAPWAPTGRQVDQLVAEIAAATTTTERPRKKPARGGSRVGAR